MPTFDPTKRYTWDEDSKIILTGNQFGIILNTLRTALSDPEAQKIIMLHKASEAAEKVLEENVLMGIAKEVAPPRPKAVAEPGNVPLPPMKKVEDAPEQQENDSPPSETES